MPSPSLFSWIGLGALVVLVTGSTFLLGWFSKQYFGYNRVHIVPGHLKRLRDWAGLDAQTMASELRVSDTEYVRIEATDEIRTRELLRVLAYFPVTSEWLLTGNGVSPAFDEDIDRQRLGVALGYFLTEHWRRFGRPADVDDAGDIARDVALQTAMLLPVKNVQPVKDNVLTFRGRFKR